MTDDLENRIEEVATALSMLKGNGMDLDLPNGGQMTVALLKREVDLIWIDISAIKEDIGQIKAKLGM